MQKEQPLHQPWRLRSSKQGSETCYCFIALGRDSIAQVRNRAFLYTGSVAVFDANFIQLVELLSAAPFTYYFWVIVIHVLAIDHLGKNNEWYKILDQKDNVYLLRSIALNQISPKPISCKLKIQIVYSLSIFIMLTFFWFIISQ